MDLLNVIKYLYPNLIDLTDYIVEDNGNGAELNWLNTEIIKPTQEELNVGWTSYQNKKVISEKITKIRELKREIRSYSGSITDLDNVEFDAIEVYEISKLKTEYNTLKTELDTYDQTTVESILNPDNIDYSLYGEEEEEVPPPSSGGESIIGEIKIRPSSVIPQNWMICDGREINVLTYPKLHLIIGERYGNPRDNVVNIPNLKGKVPVGKNTTGTFTSLGNTYGSETHKLTNAELPYHTHSYGTLKEGSGGTAGGGGSGMNIQYYNSGSAGSNYYHNNIQPSLIINYIIKFQ